MNIILKNRGNYKELLTFKKATVIFDLTYHFCQKYLTKGDRTVDQMIQAARSGKQNIAEGVAASSTNAETEIKLVNVAKASLKELLTDCKSLTTRAEVMQTGLQATDNVDNNENRSFDLNASYTVKITVPYCHGFDYIDKVIIYLNENKIYEKEYVEPDKTENPQP